MLRSSLCDYSDAYILVKGNVTVNDTATDGADANNTNKKVIFKNCAPFTNCISKINNTQIDNAEYIHIVMPMYNLIEYSDNYSKISGGLWQYFKDIPAIDNDGDIADFNGANATDSFNFKTKITGQTNDYGIINVEIMVPLKYLSNFWRTLEMPLINCEVELILTWSANCVIIYTNVNNQVPTFTITETNLYVTLSTQDNEKLLPQLKSGFKRKISWNKYLAKPELLVSSNMVGDNETNFPQKLLSADIKLSKTQLSKMIQSGGFLGRLLGPLLKTGLPLIKNVIKPLTKSILIPLGLTAAASAADAGINKKVLGSGHNNTTLIISNDEIEDIIKIVKSLEDSGLLLKGVTKTVKNEVKGQKGGFLSALLGTLGASLLGDLLIVKRIYRAGKGKGKGVLRTAEGVLRAGYRNNNKMDF